MGDAIAKQIAQLEEARKHVLADAVHYSAIIPGILPIIGPSAHLDIRRWGTEFLAEGFASPALSMHAKEALAVQVLQLLKELLEVPTEDEYVIKSVIQTASSIYGLIFRHMYVIQIS
jgi:symplekin